LKRTISLAQGQAVLAEKMSKELVLVALEVDTERNLKNLESSRALFERTLKGLRDGDAGLGLPRSTSRDFIDNLGKAGELWLVYDAAIRTSFASGRITADQVGTVADLTAPITAAMDSAVAVLESETSEGRLVSLLDATIELAGRQRLLTQKMSREFLLIAYGHEVDKNRRQLKESIAQFDRTLDGLISGNTELRLVPAPSAEIKAQMRKVARIWDTFLPIVTTASKGGEIDRETIARMASANEPLLEAVSAARLSYNSL
ncbi:MAG: type IV pili methyl-accepting chemotaxis transducer N-terminal domain-containing protein, partial [Rhodospirillales bacterium]|nr:type IV pili methyl-accepting chemotaxis transducer N-terminal domain-containing protein [Rhodospirillales bacterium]